MNDIERDLKQSLGNKAVEGIKRLAKEAYKALHSIEKKLKDQRQESQQLRQVPVDQNLHSKIYPNQNQADNFAQQTRQTIQQFKDNSKGIYVYNTKVKTLVDVILTDEVTDQTAPYIHYLLDQAKDPNLDTSPSRKIALANEVRDLLDVEGGLLGRKIVRELLDSKVREAQVNNQLTVQEIQAVAQLDNRIAMIEGETINTKRNEFIDILNNTRLTADVLRNVALRNILAPQGPEIPTTKNYQGNEIQQSQDLVKIVTELKGRFDYFTSNPTSWSDYFDQFISINRNQPIPAQRQEFTNNLINNLNLTDQRTIDIVWDSFNSRRNFLFANELIKEIAEKNINQNNAPYLFHLFDKIFTVNDLMDNGVQLIDLARELAQMGLPQQPNIQSRPLDLFDLDPLFAHRVSGELLKHADHFPAAIALRQQEVNVLRQRMETSQVSLKEVFKESRRKSNERINQINNEIDQLTHNINTDLLSDEERELYNSLFPSYITGDENLLRDEGRRQLLQRLWEHGGVNNASFPRLWELLEEKIQRQREFQMQGRDYIDLFYTEEQKKDMRMHLNKEYFDYINALLSEGNPNEDTLSEQGKERYRDKIIEVASVLYEDLDRFPTAFSQDILNSFYITPVKTEMNKMMSELEKMFRGLGLTKKADFIKAMNEEKNILLELQQSFHDSLILVNMGAGFDKWLETIQKFPASDYARLWASNRHGALLKAAMQTIELYLQFDAGLNGNHPRPELLGGTFKDGMYHTPDYEKMRGMLERQLGKDFKNLQDWELDRALGFARGYLTLVDLRMPELIASMDPREDYKGGPLHMILQFIDMKWSWGVGRGGPYWRQPNEVGILKKLPVSRKGKGFFQLLKEGGWSPSKVKEFISTDFEDSLGKEVALRAMNSIAFLEDLPHIFGFAGRASRHGWRETPAIQEFFTNNQEFKRKILNAAQQLKEVFNNFGAWKKQADFDTFYQYLREEVGAGAELWYSEQRAQLDLKNFIKNRFVVDGSFRKELLKFFDESNRISAESILNRYEQLKSVNKEAEFDFKDQEWDVINEKDFEFELGQGANKRKINAFDFIQEQKFKYDAKAYNHLLKRSPIAFLLPISQLVPEILMSNAEWAAMKQGRRNDLNIRFGEKDRNGNVTMSGLQKLERFRKFFKDAAMAYGYDLDSDSFSKNKDIAHKIISDLNQSFLTVQREKRGVINPIVDIGNTDLRRAVQNLFDAIQGESNLIEGINIMPNQQLTEAQIIEQVAGDYLRYKNNIFYCIASEYDRNGFYFPTTADIDRKILDDTIAHTGEETYKRMYGDIATGLKDINGAFGTIEDTLRTIADTDDESPLYQIMQKAMNLRGFISLRRAHQANYILLNTATRFFEEDWLTAIPGIGPLAKLALGKKTAISKMWFNDWKKASWGRDRILKVIEKCKFAGFVAEKGAYSGDEAAKSTGSNLAKLILTEAGPTILMIIAAYLLFQFLTKANKESEGKK